MGGISAFELSFGDKWNVEMEQSVAESHAHRTPSALQPAPICTLHTICILGSCLCYICILHSFSPASELRLLKRVAKDGKYMLGTAQWAAK